MDETAPAAPEPIKIIDTYVEPPHVEKLLEEMTTVLGGMKITPETKPFSDLLMVLFARIISLERVMMPFAVQGMTFDNARMNLAAKGRKGEPAGGTWVSHVENIHITHNENIFFDLIDVLGRERTQNHMVQVFEELKARSKAAEEKAAHVAAGGKVQ